MGRGVWVAGEIIWKSEDLLGFRSESDINSLCDLGHVTHPLFSPDL